ncbi:hypothetical protein PCL_07269 [Purpureocillium lilacinum]|uniref:Uncharacterized protein n=1 Tax=Purpureocillium lilacinum TaxID=33203 RepID=A0A2U3DSJ7_PURLI|nr:hypothetical protein PCL_07269 [Purpureocillium lilacinum]
MLAGFGAPGACKPYLTSKVRLGQGIAGSIPTVAAGHTYFSQFHVLIVTCTRQRAPRATQSQGASSSPEASLAALMIRSTSQLDEVGSLKDGNTMIVGYNSTNPTNMPAKATGGPPPSLFAFKYAFKKAKLEEEEEEYHEPRQAKDQKTQISKSHGATSAAAACLGGGWLAVRPAATLLEGRRHSKGADSHEQQPNLQKPRGAKLQPNKCVCCPTKPQIFETAAELSRSVLTRIHPEPMGARNITGVGSALAGSRVRMKQNVIKALLMSGDGRGPASRCQGVTEPFTAHRHNGEKMTLVAIVAMSSWSGCAVNGGCDHDGIPSIYATQQD